MLAVISMFILLLTAFLCIKEGLKRNKTAITFTYILYFALLTVLMCGSIYLFTATEQTHVTTAHKIVSVTTYLIPGLQLIIYYLFTNKKFKSKLWVPVIMLLPVIFSLLTITNRSHHLMYIIYASEYAKCVPGPLHLPSLFYVYGFMVLAYIVLVIGNYRENKTINNKLYALLFITALAVFIPVLYYLRVFKTDFYLPSIILGLYGILSYYIIMKYQYITAVPYSLESAINFISTPIAVVDIYGEIVYSNSVFRSFLKNVLGIFVPITNLFKLLSAFDHTLTESLKVTLKKLYKIPDGKYVKDAVLYGLDEKIYVQITMQEIKGTNYYLFVFRNINQQKKEVIDIESKQSIINVQSQLATVGELALGVVHDIKTPITALNTAIEILKQTQLTKKDEEILDSMKTSADKIALIASSIKDQFKNADSIEKTKFNLSLFVHQTIFNVKHRLDDAKIYTSLDLDDNIEITGNQSKLSQVMLNVLFNSIKAYQTNERKGGIYISSYKKGGNVLIKITDNAGGIPEYLRPHIFKTILTTKGTKGFGLGLYIANSIMQAEFNGNLDFYCVGDSTTITLTIPMRGV